MIGKVGIAVIAALLLVSAAPVSVEAAVCKGSKVSALGKWHSTMFSARECTHRMEAQGACRLWHEVRHLVAVGQQELRLLAIQEA